MSGSHSHHDHHHPEPEFNRAFLISVIANGVFVVLQIIFAFITNSNRLLADGIHNLGDVLGLILAWGANAMLARKPTARSTFGMKKTTILAAFANGSILLFTCGIIVTEAIYKFISVTTLSYKMPSDQLGGTMWYKYEDPYFFDKQT